MQKHKKLFLILGGLVVVILVGFFLYRKTVSPNTSGSPVNLGGLFPFGSNKAPDQQQGTTGTEAPADQTTPQETNTANVRLFKISNDPVAGSGIIAKTFLKYPDAPVVTTPVTPVKKGSKPVVPPAPETEIKYFVRLVEAATGHIDEWSPETTYTTRITNTTIPRIHDALFNATGDRVILRYFDEQSGQITTYGAALTPDTSSGTLSKLVGNYFPYNISDIVSSPDKTRLFYSFPVEGNTIGITTGFDGTDKKQVFTSAFSEWILSWANARTVTVTTKASGFYPGYLYKITSTNGAMERVTGKALGMTTLMSPDGSNVLVGEARDNSVRLYLYNSATGLRTDTGLATLPEKCVWAPNALAYYCAVPSFVTPSTYPDAWYQGKVSFSDALWKVSVTNNISQLLESPSEDGYLVDATKLELSPDGKFMTFIDKQTGLLFALKL